MPSNEQQALDLFGEALMNNVRDTQMRLWDQTLAGTVKSRPYKLMHEKLKSIFDSEQIAALERLMPWVVDNTIADIMGMLQDKHNQVDVIIRTNEEAISLYAASDLLNGELWGEEGWISRFSKERPTDDAFFAEELSSE